MGGFTEMLQEPRVTVMVANRNNGSYLGPCLSSLLGQTFDDFEVVVVDDGSTDDSLEVCARFARTDRRLQVIDLETHFGVSYARQTALSKARGEYIAILDADDVAL